MLIRDRIKEFRRVKASELRPNPSNWRTHSEKQRNALRGVLSEIGYADALIARECEDGSLMLLDGHLRAETTPDTLVPVLVTDLDEAEGKKLLATLDPLAAMADADKEQLDSLLREVQTSNEDLAGMLTELATEHGIIPAANGDAPEDPGPQIDRAAELQAKWKTSRGQLWRIGKHRLLCGDSTKAADVAELNRDDDVQVLVTSPPYWTAQPYDDKPGSAGAREFMRRFVAAWSLVPRRRLIIQTGQTNSTMIGDGGPIRKIILDAMWAEVLAQSGWLLRHRRLWVKSGALLGGCINPEADLIDESCEVVLTFYQPGHNEGGQERVGEKWAQQGYWDDVRGVSEDGHPCPYPTEIAARVIRLYSTLDGIVADPFIGSGTTMIAAEQTGRICYGIEIEPKYVAVCLERLAGMGLEPQLSDLSA